MTYGRWGSVLRSAQLIEEVESLPVLDGASVDSAGGGGPWPVDRMRGRRNRVEYPDPPGVPPGTETEVAGTPRKIDANIDSAARVLDSMSVWN